MAFLNVPLFFKKHWTFSKIPRDVFEKTTVCFFGTFYPIFSDESRFAIMAHRLYLNSLP